MASPRGRQPHPLTTSSLPRPGRQRPAGEEAERSRASPPLPRKNRRAGGGGGAAPSCRSAPHRPSPAATPAAPTGRPPPAAPLLLPPRPPLPEMLTGRTFSFFFNKNNKTVAKGKAAGRPGSRGQRRRGPGSPAPSPLPRGERPGDSGHLPPGRPPHSLAPARTHGDGEGQRSAEPQRPCPAVQGAKGKVPVAAPGPLRPRPRRPAPLRSAEPGGGQLHRRPRACAAARARRPPGPSADAPPAPSG